MENLRKMIDKDFIEVSKQKLSIPEISDEEIEKASEDWQEYRQGAGKQSFEQGAKWYREQLKQNL